MAKYEILAEAYIEQRDSLLAQWRANLKQSNSMEMFSLEKTRFDRKLRAIFPRGKLGLEIKKSLAYYTS